MSIRVGINGFGRIGRLVFRQLIASSGVFDVMGINDIMGVYELDGKRTIDNEIVATLLKHDSIHRRFPGTVDFDDESLIVNGKEVRVTHENDPAKLPWGELGVDVVLESTGVFRKRKTAGMSGFDSHLDAGAKKVIISAPTQSPDLTCVLGVNDDKITEDHRCISNSSPAIHCLAPVVKVLNERFGVTKGLVTIMHAYTNDQVVHDFPHKDLYRSRGAAQNVIAVPTYGLGETFSDVLPEMRGRLSGHSVRMPVPIGCATDLVVETAMTVTPGTVNTAIEEAAIGELSGILRYCEDPIVSSDVIGDSHSSIFAADFTQVLGGNMLKVVCWNDNEWAYSCRCVELAERMVRP